MGNYQVVIEGFKEEIDEKIVLENLVLLFKISKDKLSALVNSKRFVVRRSIDLNTAKKIQRAIDQAGCKVIIESDLAFDFMEMSNSDLLNEDEDLGVVSVSVDQSDLVFDFLEINSQQILSEKNHRSTIDSENVAELHNLSELNFDSTLSFNYPESVQLSSSPEQIQPVRSKKEWIKIVAILIGLFGSIMIASFALRNKDVTKDESLGSSPIKVDKKLIEYPEISRSGVLSITKKYSYKSINKTVVEVRDDLWDMAHNYQQVNTICLTTVIDGLDEYGNIKEFNIGTLVMQPTDLSKLREYKDKEYLNASESASLYFLSVVFFLNNPNGPYCNGMCETYRDLCPIEKQAKINPPDININSTLLNKTSVVTNPDKPIDYKKNYQVYKDLNDIQVSFWQVALTELYGLVDTGSKINTSKDKLSSIWFEQSFDHENNSYHVVFIKTQKIDETGEIERCHACSVEIGAVTFKKVTDKWQVISKQLKITDVGSGGDAPETTKAEVFMLSPTKMTFLIADSYGTMGQFDAGDYVFVFSKNNWLNIGYILTESNDNGNCEEGDVTHCFSYKGNISVVPGDKEYPDLLITKIGTEGKDHKGNALPAKNTIYMFKDTQYEEDKPLSYTSELTSTSDQNIKNMLEGSLKSDEKMIADNKLILENLPKPAKGNRKSARLANDEGLVFFQSKQYEKAVPLFEKASQLDTSDIEVMNNYGYALMKSNQLEKAKSVLINAMIIKPDRVSAWANYADILAMDGKEDLSVAAYLNAFRFSKDINKTIAFFNKQLVEESNPSIHSALIKAIDKSQVIIETRIVEFKSLNSSK